MGWFSLPKQPWLPAKAEDLAGYLADRALTENLTLLVQPALLNHPDLRTDRTKPWPQQDWLRAAQSRAK